MPKNEEKKSLKFTSVGELNKISEDVKVAINNAFQCKQYCKAANDIFRKADNFYKEKDEEQSYMLFMRYFFIVQSIKKNYEFVKSKNVYLPILKESNVESAITKAEELSKSLNLRYKKRDDALAQQKEIETKKKLEKANLKRTVENSGKSNSAKKKGSDNIDFPDVPNDISYDNDKDAVVPDDVNVNIDITPEVPQKIFPSRGFLTVIELYSLFKEYKDKLDSILLIDIRSTDDYSASRIEHKCMINVPEQLLQKGANINTVERKLNKESWEIWSSRFHKESIVLLNSELLDTVNISASLLLLQDILCKFEAKYKVYILLGGFKKWILHYPSMSTDPFYSRKATLPVTEYDSTSFLKNLTYPELPSTAKKKDEEIIQPDVVSFEDKFHPKKIIVTDDVPSINRGNKPSLNNVLPSAGLTSIKDNDNIVPVTNIVNSSSLTPNLSQSPSLDINSVKGSYGLVQNIGNQNISSIAEQTSNGKKKSNELPGTGTSIYGTNAFTSPSVILTTQTLPSVENVSSPISSSMNAADISTSTSTSSAYTTSNLPMTLPPETSNATTIQPQLVSTILQNIQPYVAPSASTASLPQTDIQPPILSNIPQNSNTPAQTPIMSNLQPHNQQNVNPPKSSSLPLNVQTNIQPSVTSSMLQNINATTQVPITSNLSSINQTNTQFQKVPQIIPVNAQPPIMSNTVQNIHSNIQPSSVPQNVQTNTQPPIMTSVPPNIQANVQPLPSTLPQNNQTSIIPLNMQQTFETNNQPQILPNLPQNIQANVKPSIPSNLPQNIPQNNQDNVKGQTPSNFPQSIPAISQVPIPSNMIKNIQSNVSTTQNNQQSNVPSMPQVIQNVPSNISGSVPLVNPVISTPNLPLANIPPPTVASVLNVPPVITPPTFSQQPKVALQKVKPPTNNTSRKFTTTFGLPTGWEKAVSHETGRIYYKDHNTQTTHWTLPPEILAQINKNDVHRVDSMKPKGVNHGSTSMDSKASLKRSLSTPNIADLIIDDDSGNNTVKETAVHSKPVIDRGVKPKEQRQVLVDRSKKPISASRLQKLSPVYGSMGHGLTGLKNLGNTCYMNSVIQCLSNTMPLRQYFTSGMYEQDLNTKNMNSRPGEIARELSFVIIVLSAGQYRSVSPIDFKSALGRFSSQFNGSQQQDSHELLMFLLDGLHEDINKVKTRQVIKERNNENQPDHVCADQAWNDYLLNNNSIIVNLFQGQFRSTVVCLTCGHKSKTYDAFNCLQLELPSNKSATLQDCISLFTKAEKMGGNDSWKCSKCKCYREASKTIEVWKLPPVLIIQLKRFRCDGRWRNKIQSGINFPLKNLNIANHVVGPKSSFLNYHLYGVINHYGSFESGHYTAYCENINNSRWYSFDDNIVKEMDPDSIKTNAAYLLFYTAVDFRDGS